MRVADYIVDHLEKIGVREVFLLSGGGMMHLLDAVSRREKLKYICNHHEQASGIAADAYARVKGSLGVCFATSGPGGTNTVTAVAGAYQDSSPVLFISGQSKTSQTIAGSKIEGLRQFGTFEVDIIPIVKPITKYAAIVLNSADIRYHLEKAIYLALNGRPGAVFLDIPLDVQGANIEPGQLRGFDPSELKSEGSLNKSILDKLLMTSLDKLKTAKKPLILVGYGVRAAGEVENFRDLVKIINIPVVTTSFGTDVLEYENTLFVGHPGVKGDRAGNFAIQSADFILCLGTSLHVTTTGYELEQFAPNAYKVLIDLDKAVLERENVNVQQKINCDIKTFIQMFSSLVTKENFSLERNQWHEKCLNWKLGFSVYREQHQRKENKINFYDFAEKLDEALADTDVIVTDAGSAFYVIGQAFRVKKNQRIINSGSLGAMGFAIPASTGAAVAAPERRVVCVTGDGSMMTNIHELAVIRKNNLNIKIFIVNNDGYVCIRNTQNNFFNGQLAGTSQDSGVLIPNIEKLANAFDLPYLKIESTLDLKSSIDDVLKSDGPFLCEIVTPSFQEIIPTVSSIRLDNGAMKSKPLQDMYPFMDEDVLKKILKD